MWLVIDSTGAVWPERHPALLARLSTEASPATLREFVTRNMGYVAVENGHSSTRLHCNPRLVAPDALARSLLLLKDGRAPRVALATYVSGEWRYEIVARDVLSAHLARVVSAAQAGRSPALQRKALTPDEVAELPGTEPLRALLDAWQRVKSGDAPPRYFLETLARQRYVFAELHREDRQLYVKSVGRELEIARHFTPDKLQPVMHHPDRRYGRWIAQHYLEALISGQPVFDEIQASIALQEGDRRNHRYLRLLLPLKRDLLLSATVAA